MQPTSDNNVFQNIHNSLENIQSELENIETSKNPSKIVYVQQWKLKELIKTLDRERTKAFSEKSEKNVDLIETIGDQVFQTMRKAEVLRSHILKGGPIFTLPEHSTVYDFIEAHQYPEGNAYTFREKDMTHEEYLSISIELFPAVVFNLERLDSMKERFPELWNVLKELGYDIDFERKLVTVPDGPLLNAKAQSLKAEYPGLSSFEAVEMVGIASDDAFLDLYDDGKNILSEDVEFLHDHLAHLVPELLMRVQGNYSSVRETIGRTINPIRSFIKTTQTELARDARSVDKKTNLELELKQLLSICTMWVDNVSPDVLNPQDSLNHDVNIFNFIQILDSGIGLTKMHGETLLVRTFDEQYPDHPLSKEITSHFFALATVILYPEVVESGQQELSKKMLELLRRNLTNVDIKLEKGNILSFQKGSNPPINAIDHPLEVIALLKEEITFIQAS